MERLILICAAVLLLMASPAVRADPLKPGEFPVSDERMADLIELAADGNLAIPAAAAPKDPAAAGQITFLRNVMKARDAAQPGSPGGYADQAGHGALIKARVSDYYPAECCFRAVIAARAGDFHRAQLFLEESLRSTHKLHSGYCLVLYRRCNGDTQSYRFLHWWSMHVLIAHPSLSVLTLMIGAQFLALPLLFKLRHAIVSRRHGQALVRPVLAVAFAEGVPLFWAVAAGSAWTFAYPSAFAYGPDGHETGVAFFGPLASVCSILIGIAVMVMISGQWRNFADKKSAAQWAPVFVFGFTFMAIDLLVPEYFADTLSSAGLAVGFISYSGDILAVAWFSGLAMRKNVRRRRV